METVIDGYAPYWSVMLKHDSGAQSIAAGVHGMTTDVLLDAEDPGSPADRYRDLALDMQYQYIGDEHIVTTEAALIREKRIWRASLPAGSADNPSDWLRTLNLNVHYWHRRRIGGGIKYFSTWGSSDLAKYGMSEASATGNATGSPDSRGWTMEVNYLPLKDQNLKLGLRRTVYSKFNGARTDYNGFGRDAADNNITFVYAWLLF